MEVSGVATQVEVLWAQDLGAFLQPNGYPADKRSKKPEEHVYLCIEDVALHPEEVFGEVFGPRHRRKLDHLVERGNRKDRGDCEECRPLGRNLELVVKIFVQRKKKNEPRE